MKIKKTQLTNIRIQRVKKMYIKKWLPDSISIIILIDKHSVQ